MIVVPHSKDQFINAKRIVDLNLGLEILRNCFHREMLIKSVKFLLENALVKSNLKKFKTEYQQLPDYSQATKYIYRSVKEMQVT